MCVRHGQLKESGSLKMIMHSLAMSQSHSVLLSHFNWNTNNASRTNKVHTQISIHFVLSGWFNENKKNRGTLKMHLSPFTWHALLALRSHCVIIVSVYLSIDVIVFIVAAIEFGFCFFFFVLDLTEFLIVSSPWPRQ